MSWGSDTVDAWLSAIGVGHTKGNDVRNPQSVPEKQPDHEPPPAPAEPDGARWVVERIQKLY